MKRRSPYRPGQSPTTRIMGVSVPLVVVVSVLVLIGLMQMVWLGSKLPTSATSHLVATSTQKPAKPPHRWAYVFLLANCDPSVTSPAYRGMLYNIVAATYVLKEEHSSVADVVVLVQLAATSPMDRLLPAEEALLRRMNIIVRYLIPPLNPSPTFYELVMTKFYVLSMTEYSRILFLDGDVLPLCSLDYWLEASHSGRFRQTVLHAMYDDPVNAGLWVVTPRVGVYEQLQQEHFHWNATTTANSQYQWGAQSTVHYRVWRNHQSPHVIGSGEGWDFYCGNSDQGFLLYYGRFLQHDVSIVVGPTIEHYWKEGEGSTPERRTLTKTQSWANSSCLAPGADRSQTWAQNVNPATSQMPLYQDFFHMVGFSKAWEHAPNPAAWTATIAQSELVSSAEYWYWIVHRVAERFDSHRTVIPHPVTRIPEMVGKPSLRGDLFAVGKSPGM